MKVVFADTFFWIALLNTHESKHDEVTRWLEQNQNKCIITTDEVVIEMLNAFSGYVFRMCLPEMPTSPRKDSVLC